MKLYAAVVAAILAVTALGLLAKWGHHEGRVAAYRIQLAQCRQTYPRYRCEVELARDYSDVQR